MLLSLHIVDKVLFLFGFKWYGTSFLRTQCSHGMNSMYVGSIAFIAFHPPLQFFFLLPLLIWKDHLILNQDDKMSVWKVSGYWLSPVEWWDQSLSISSLNLSQSCLDKHDWSQINSKTLCSARLASSAMWSFYWEQSSALPPNPKPPTLGDWQSAPATYLLRELSAYLFIM